MRACNNNNMRNPITRCRDGLRMLLLLHALIPCLATYKYAAIIPCLGAYNILPSPSVYVMYKPWPRGVYVRYTPAVRNLFVIFPEGQRPEGYITNKLPNIAGVYLKIYTDWTWFIRYMLC